MNGAHELPFALSIKPTTSQRGRWCFPLALVALIIGSAISQAPLAAGSLNPYVNYNSRLLWLYGNDIIGYETLNRFWYGGSLPKTTIDAFVEMHEIAGSLAKSTATSMAPKQAAHAAVTGDYSLSSSTPVLPFGGNQLVVLGGALFANATNLAAVTFRRQADCSLVEDIFEPVNNRLTPASVVELPGVHDFLHTLSGLTTIPDVFPNGCTELALGKTAVRTWRRSG
jgi:hypothetical protein